MINIGSKTKYIVVKPAHMKYVYITCAKIIKTEQYFMLVRILGVTSDESPHKLFYVGLNYKMSMIDIKQRYDIVDTLPEMMARVL